MTVHAIRCKVSGEALAMMTDGGLCKCEGPCRLGRKKYDASLIEKMTLREAGHMRGDGWFGYTYDCVQEPRLQRRVRYIRKTRSHDLTWYVDGKTVGIESVPGSYFPIDLIVEALNRPPELADDERAALARVGEEYEDLRKVLDPLVLLSLRAKGQVEMSDGKTRLRKERWVV